MILYKSFPHFFSSLNKNKLSLTWKWDRRETVDQYVFNGQQVLVKSLGTLLILPQFSFQTLFSSVHILNVALQHCILCFKLNVGLPKSAQLSLSSLKHKERHRKEFVSRTRLYFDVLLSNQVLVQMCLNISGQHSEDVRDNTKIVSVSEFMLPLF